MDGESFAQNLFLFADVAFLVEAKAAPLLNLII
jgi:hypothetical protein